MSPVHLFFFFLAAAHRGGQTGRLQIDFLALMLRELLQYESTLLF